MALVRILVDGYSLLHQWPELAHGKARHSEAARKELISILTDYQDSTGTPVTVVFDGAGGPKHLPRVETGHAVEVIFSKSGQTADDIIERVVHRMKPYGEVMVVTDDFAERDTVMTFGGTPVGCGIFIRMIADAAGELQEDLQRLNRKERQRFRSR
jgi:predicted RNA-binding protein with PIN domain